MYGELDPMIFYGVVEESSDRMISEAFLEEFGLERQPTNLVRLHACSFVYGYPVKLDGVGRGKVSDGTKTRLTKFVAALKKRGIDLGEPKFHLVVSGYDYDVQHKEYLKNETVDPSEVEGIPEVEEDDDEEE